MTPPPEGLVALQRHLGKYRGLVTDNADPLDRGRIRAKVPEVLGDVETGWAYPCAPLAGPDMGLFTIPEPGAGVWVEFEAGDPSRPIWVGCWWGDGQVPAQAKPAQKVLKSATGHTITLDDEGKAVTIEDSAGQSVTMDDNGIAVADRHGQTIRMTSSKVEVAKGPTTVVLEASAVKLSAGSQSIEVGPAMVRINGGALEVM